MKKYLFLLLTGFTFSTAQSQETTDAIRYSQDNLNGTARFRAMGGAFGALGGDLSAITINPAGAAVFTNNQIAMTLSSYNTKNNSNYFGSETLKMIVRQPLETTKSLNQFDVYANVFGGGISGQAGAIRHGISRALLEVNTEMRPSLKKAGFITRDPRMKERKKYGQKGARKRFQFSKR